MLMLLHLFVFDPQGTPFQFIVQLFPNGRPKCAGSSKHLDLLGLFMKSFIAFSRHLTALLLLFLPLILHGAPSHDSPEHVVQKLYRAVAENNADAYMSCFSFKGFDQNDKKIMQLQLKEVLSITHEKLKEDGGLQSVKTGILERKGNTARVEAVVTSGSGQSGTETLTLIWEEGGWKIDLLSELQETSLSY